MAYFVPAILTTSGLIAPEWITIDESGAAEEQSSNLYYMASRYLLPAALVLMTLSMDLKAVFNLGPKALIMFFTGTAGIILGAPIALLIVSLIYPDALATPLTPVPGPGETNEIWAGLSTVSGSWIGGGANQTAMFEIYGYNPKLFGQMVFVDIVVANIWMALLLIGIGKATRIDKWLNSDTSAIERLKEKVTAFSKKVERNPSFADMIILTAIAFGTVSLAHFGAGYISSYFEAVVNSMDPGLSRNLLSFMSSSFSWMITIATIIGVVLSYTKAKNYEGAGASKFGSVFIYILVATIGMKMDIRSLGDYPGLFMVGAIWMMIHVVLLVIVGRLIRAPYFFLAVGSKANIGGAASAPVLAAAFHPALAPVGVLLAVFGYVLGTYGAWLCGLLMQAVAP